MVDILLISQEYTSIEEESITLYERKGKIFWLRVERTEGGSGKETSSNTIINKNIFLKLIVHLNILQFTCL